jgi:hypothetical protein
MILCWKKLGCVAALAMTVGILVGVPAQAEDPKACGTVVIPANSDITSFSPLFADLGKPVRADRLDAQPCDVDHHAG